MGKFGLLMGSWALLNLIACSSDNGHASNKIENAKQISVTTTDDLRAKEVKLLWDEYLRLRDALVRAEAEEANKWALSLGVSTQNFPTEKLNDEELLRWKRQQKEIWEQTTAINGATLEKQRELFEGLSKTMYQVVTELGLPKGVTVFQQQCPMAFDNRGAWWLSDRSDIVNPYFGMQMLNCGTVTEAIQFN